MRRVHLDWVPAAIAPHKSSRPELAPFLPLFAARTAIGLLIRFSWLSLAFSLVCFWSGMLNCKPHLIKIEVTAHSVMTTIAGDLDCAFVIVARNSATLAACSTNATWSAGMPFPSFL
jgi:hypothetical protein